MEKLGDAIFTERYFTMEDCWLLFVKVTYLLCRRTITEEHLKEADEKLTEFWEVNFLARKLVR